MILLQEGEMTAQLVSKLGWGERRKWEGIMCTLMSFFFFRKKSPPFHENGKENVFFVITRST